MVKNPKPTMKKNKKNYEFESYNCHLAPKPLKKRQNRGKFTKIL